MPASDGGTPVSGGDPALFESRVVLTPRNPQALRAIMSADMRRSEAQFAHRIIWTLFADAVDDQRRGLFLYHVERSRPFTAIVRSSRPPIDGLGVWTFEKTRPFAPHLAAGQRLRFRLRAVASRWQQQPGTKRGRRQDVIMAAWHTVPEDERTPERLEDVAEAAALSWLERQGERCGFAVTRGEVSVLDYDRMRLSAGRAGGDIRFGAVTYEGLLTVTDPPLFRQALAEGLGAGRAYGNGLMQIAPART
ncbi:MAG: type I-E CRISPR-associated protein Cas6/Cse3/CasE [Rhodospirillaceae bacterium]|nr:type I-E CRISPR-associated protein Cas6/Cse3/CasE [Rhodospirillaceae bacterium]